MQVKKVSEKLEEYKILKKLADDIEKVISTINEVDKKEPKQDICSAYTSGSFLWPSSNIATWSSNTPYVGGVSPYTTISINSDIISLIKDDIKDLLKKKLVEIKDKMDKLEI